MGPCSGFQTFRKVLQDMYCQSLQNRAIRQVILTLIEAFETVSVARGYNILFIWISYLNNSVTVAT